MSPRHETDDSESSSSSEEELKWVKKKSKKSKKSKKKKSKKKSKKKKHASSSSEDSSDDAWVEKDAPAAAEQAVPKAPDIKAKASESTSNEWLSMALSSSGDREKISSQRGRRAEGNKEVARIREEKEAANRAKASQRELNPYIKGEHEIKPTVSQSTGSPGKGPSSAAWLQRALQRAKEQASREGRTLEEVAAERWGSLRKLQDMIDKAEGGDSRHSSSSWKTQSRRDDEAQKRHVEAREAEERQRAAKRASSSSDESPKRPEEEARERPTEVEEEPVLSEKELNALGAKLIKAEMLGNTALAEKLKAKLGRARTCAAQYKGKKSREETVVLTKTDSKGQTRPMSASEVEAATSGASRAQQHKGKRKAVNTFDDGKRTKYFPDDDRYSLGQLFEQEKQGNSEDPEKAYRKLASRAKGRFDEDFDDVVADQAARDDSGRQYAKDAQAAKSAYQKRAARLDRCSKCIQNRDMKKHLVVAVGEYCYLAVPEGMSLADGHCVLTPNEHALCATQVDENVWNEIQDFRKALVRMFAAQEQDCVFFESALLLRQHPHMLIHCVPVSMELGSMAPMYFQKAIQECESEWADNVKLISLKKKDLRHSVPRELPYFHVDFGLQDGFAHVVEDENTFSQEFGQEILGGMLELHPSEWRRKKESFDAQRQRVLDFSKLWKEFDITRTQSRRRSSSSSSDES